MRRVSRTIAAELDFAAEGRAGAHRQRRGIDIAPRLAAIQRIHRRARSVYDAIACKMI